MNADADILLPPTPSGAVPGGVELLVAADQDAPLLARHAAGRALASWTRERREIALLVISELVTNAVLHGSDGPASVVSLSIRRSGRATRIAVRDPSAHGTAPDVGEHPHPGAGARSGWGLAIVGELTDRWGTEQGADGTTVWCELDD